MKSPAQPRAKPTTPAEYLDALPTDRELIMRNLRAVIRKNIPEGFQEGFSYGAIWYGVPHSIYPAGYHCDPKMPLPFMGIASQKSHIGLYHMGIYCDPKLMAWFTTEWKKHSTKKLDMGKSCARFKRAEDVPLKLIGELAKRMTVKEWVGVYENELAGGVRR